MTAADEISGQSRVTVMTCSRNLSPSLSITTLTVAFTLAHAAKEGSGITQEEERDRKRRTPSDPQSRVSHQAVDQSVCESAVTEDRRSASLDEEAEKKSVTHMTGRLFRAGMPCLDGLPVLL